MVMVFFEGLNSIFLESHVAMVSCRCPTDDQWFFLVAFFKGVLIFMGLNVLSSSLYLTTFYVSTKTLGASCLLS